MFKSNIEIYGKRETNNLQTIMYYQDAVLQELQNLINIPNSVIDSGGLKIYTTLDMQKQKVTVVIQKLQKIYGLIQLKTV